MIETMSHDELCAEWIVQVKRVNGQHYPFHVYHNNGWFDAGHASRYRRTQVERFIMNLRRKLDYVEDERGIP